MILLNQACLTVCPVSPDLMDYDWQYIVYMFNMNYTPESMRTAYHKEEKRKSQIASDDLLRDLGYSDKDILEKKEI